MPVPETFDARLTSSRYLSPSVRELVFERDDGKPIEFVPGQWVNLMLPGPSGEVKRAYSIASAPDGTSRFEIAVTRVVGGPGSEHLHAMPEGAVVRAIGPQGFFTRPAGDLAPSLFVATGTGVTPLRSMITAAIRAGSAAPLWLLFGARHEADILYRDELLDLARAHPNVRYEVTLSQPASSWEGRRGYVQLHVPELFHALKASASPDAPHIYICGLERMVKVVRELARGPLEVERKLVHQERYD
jgi:CDP-4-dehydro-6-deoxyglucose reductase, E3